MAATHLLSPNATREEILQAFALLANNYAIASANLAQQLPALTSAIEDMRAELVVVGTHASRSDSATSSLAGRVNILLGRVDVLLKRVTALGENAVAAAYPSLPPMRPESPSSHAMVVDAKAKIATDLKKLASQSPGPLDSVTAPIGALEDIFAKVFEEETNKRQALLAARAEAERLAAYDAAKAATERAAADEAERARLRRIEDAKDRAKERRETKRTILVGILVGTVVSIVAAGVAWTQGRLTGHEDLRVDAGTTIVPSTHP